MQIANTDWLMNSNGALGYDWNPVWGCNKYCVYCFSRELHRRKWEELYQNEIQWIKINESLLDKSQIEVPVMSDYEDFKPVWLWSNYWVEFPRMPSRIYVNSMSDPMYWKTDWTNLVLDRIALYPQHTFFFLTKNINTYRQFEFPCNCWLGVSVDTQASIDNYERVYTSVRANEEKWFPNRFFIFIEPMKECIDSAFLQLADWIIVGAGNGASKYPMLPKTEWIDKLLYIRSLDEDKGIALFFRKNLEGIYKGELIREFPDFKKV